MKPTITLLLACLCAAAFAACGNQIPVAAPEAAASTGEAAAPAMTNALQKVFDALHEQENMRDVFTTAATTVRTVSEPLFVTDDPAAIAARSAALAAARRTAPPPTTATTITTTTTAATTTAESTTTEAPAETAPTTFPADMPPIEAQPN